MQKKQEKTENTSKKATDEKVDKVKQDEKTGFPQDIDLKRFLGCGG